MATTQVHPGYLRKSKVISKMLLKCLPGLLQIIKSLLAEGVHMQSIYSSWKNLSLFEILTGIFS